MTPLTEQELTNISSFIKDRYGVNLEKKSALIEARLGLHLESRGFSSYGEYYDFLCNDATGNEVTELINRLTTNHTFFMRENDHFEYLINDIMPWIETLPSRRDLRIWCAGCSSGEEPYGLSIFLLDYLASKNIADNCNSVVLATDVSEKVLAYAAQGVYPAGNLSALSNRQIEHYFVPVDENKYKVTPQLRNNVAFQKINLLDPITPKQPFQVIFCRNVMIYFDTATKASIVDKFYDSLLPGGFLMIGHSESLTTFTHRFKYVKPSVYRKPF